MCGARRVYWVNQNVRKETEQWAKTWESDGWAAQAECRGQTLRMFLNLSVPVSLSPSPSPSPPSLCICMCLSLCTHAHVCAGSLKGQKRVWNPLNLELKALVSSLLWVSGWATITYSLWTISLASCSPIVWILYLTATREQMFSQRAKLPALDIDCPYRRTTELPIAFLTSFSEKWLPKQRLIS